MMMSDVTDYGEYPYRNPNIIGRQHDDLLSRFRHAYCAGVAQANVIAAHDKPLFEKIVRERIAPDERRHDGHGMY